MSIRIVQLGTPRAVDEGLRLGTVRRPPRGVPKSEFARRNYYDIWLPQLSPSAGLVQQALRAEDAAEWKRFVRAFRGEMKGGDASRLLDLLAALSQTTNFSLGCYCVDEQHCHRSVLRALLIERHARLA